MQLAVEEKEVGAAPVSLPADAREVGKTPESKLMYAPPKFTPTPYT